MYNQFIDEVLSDKVCVHPTDTLLGFTFNPSSNIAYDRIMEVKKRDPNKGFIMLAHSFEDAINLWRPLSKKWQQTLKEIWPASLSVIFETKDDSFSKLAINNTLAVRVPKFSQEDIWYVDVLKKLGPLPSTSINLSGKAPLLTSTAVRKEFGHIPHVYVPSVLDLKNERGALEPSTLIKIDDQNFTCLREGSVKEDTIKSILEKY